MSQKNTLFNYFQRAKPSPTATSGDKKSASSGDKKSASSADKKSTSSADKKSTSSGDKKPASSGDKKLTSSRDKKPTSSGDKKLTSSEDNKASTNGAKSSHKDKSPAGEPASSSITPKRPRPKETKGGSKEPGKSSGTKPYKRLRLISDDDSEDDCSLTNGKAAEGGEAATKPATKPAAKPATKPATKPTTKPVLSDSDEPLDDDDSEDEYKPGKHEVSSDDELADDVVPSEEDSPVKKTPKQKKPAKTTPKPASLSQSRLPGAPSTPRADGPSTPRTSGPFTPRTGGPFTPRTGGPSTPRTVSSATKTKLACFALDTERPPVPPPDADHWPHLKLEFLRPEKLRDADGRRSDDPEFNPRTLRVPAEFLDKQTPAMRQWWVLKSKYYDCVILFKMGKFYEMFHMDAVLCVKELGLLYMKGDHAHVGFPEASYGRYSAVLVAKGHRVVRVEQTETPDMMQARVAKSTKKTTKFDRVVAREACQITSKGTRTFSAVEGDACEAELSYLMAVREQEVDGQLQFGVCFVDTSVGLFHLGQFSDDCHCSRLRTLLAHYPPAQLLLARTTAPQRSRDVLTSLLPSVLRETLRPGTEFWTGEKTLRFLAEADYFKEEGEEAGPTQWPDMLLQMTKDGDALHLTPRSDCDLALQCLGAMCWYLRLCLLDTQLLAMRRFCRYLPPDVLGSSKEASSDPDPGSGSGSGDGPDAADPTGATDHTGRMVLDGITVKNLELVSNTADGSTRSTLLGALDTCATAFGKRVLRTWLCSPLRSPSAITARLDAVDDLISRADVMDDVTAALKKLPDLERLVRRIHVQGNGRLRAGSSHPDSRAIMFEEVKYSRRRILDLLSALSGFRQVAKMVRSLTTIAGDFSSYLLRCCLALEKDGGKFPDYEDVLEYFDSSFDQEEARKEGRILPSEGVDEQFDAAKDSLDQLETELEDYLREQSRHFGCKVVYYGQAKNRFQLEIPERLTHKVDGSYELQSQKKGAKRYWTDTTRWLLSRQLAAEEARAAALRDISRRMFGRFARHHGVWERAVQCVGLLDCLLALARFSRGCEVGCRPQLVTDQQQPVLEIEEGHHPWLGRSGGGIDFIPNTIDTEHGRLLLVTGPNMGGKSTLMRQAGLLVILAQLGCHVPAASFRLSPVDRIFTRLGAQDRIMSGESTFHVELSETAAIMRHATIHSLVLVDELGRGTSTFDGTAIASAVLRQLLRTGCRCLFSTHYHSLVDEFRDEPRVRLVHMACMVENENEDDPTEETITFLYRLTDGACPKSYGFNAARLAGIPVDVVRRAHQVARQFERRREKMARFAAIWRAHSAALAPAAVQ